MDDDNDNGRCYWCHWIMMMTDFQDGDDDAADDDDDNDSKVYFLSS